jgi:hypothetical protein
VFRRAPFKGCTCNVFLTLWRPASGPQLAPEVDCGLQPAKRWALGLRPPPTSLWPEITLAGAETGPISASGALAYQVTERDARAWSGGTMTISSWDDPVERFPLIERIGVKAYNVAALIVGILRPVVTLALVIRRVRYRHPARVVVIAGPRPPGRR